MKKLLTFLCLTALILAPSCGGCCKGKKSSPKPKKVTTQKTYKTKKMTPPPIPSK